MNRKLLYAACSHMLFYMLLRVKHRFLFELWALSIEHICWVVIMSSRILKKNIQHCMHIISRLHDAFLIYLYYFVCVGKYTFKYAMAQRAHDAKIYSNFMRANSTEWFMVE